MKLAVVGSRNFKDKNFVFAKLSLFFGNKLMFGDIPENYVLVSGGAKGVDSWAEEFWTKHKGEVKIFKPDWDKYGKPAGFIRNKLIIDEADKVLVFWDGTSKGTKHSIDLAIKANKPIDIYVRGLK